MTVIDTQTRQVIGRFSVGKSPHMTAVGPDGRWVYTTGQDDDSLTVTRILGLETVSTLRLGKSPEHLDVSPDGRFIYVGNFEGGTLSIVDARQRREVARLSGFANPHNITFAKDGARAFVANLGSDRVSVVNVRTRTLAASLTATSPIRLASLGKNRKVNGIINVTLTPDGRFGYAAHADSGGPQPFTGSVEASGKDTMLSRKVGGGSVKASGPLRKVLASSSSETTTLSTREPSLVVSTMGPVGLADDPR